MTSEGTNENLHKFDEATSQSLGFYVYCLLDDSRQPFYIGKGKGDRVFSHARAAMADDGPGLKFDKIREVLKATCNPPEQIILRSGLTEAEALIVESSIIDFSELLGARLTNAQLGHDSIAFGIMTASEAAFRYTARKLEVLLDPCVIVNVNKTNKRASGNNDLYEVTRGDWVISAVKRRTVKYALAEKRGLIVGVFEIEKWLPVEVKTKLGKAKTRYRFEGKTAPQSIQDRYLNFSIAHVKRQGAANPVRYTLKT